MHRPVRLAAPLLFLAAGPALVGCAGDKGDTGADGLPTSEGVVWSGWNHTWSSLSHRISLAGVMSEADGSFTSEMVGGDWSHNDLDAPTYRLHANRVTAGGFVVAHGTTTFSMGPDGSSAATETLTVDGISETANQIVVLRGFHIDASVEQSSDYPDDYDNSLGYCSNGFGFSVGAPSLSGDEVSFDVAAAVRWGPTGPDDPIDRSDMNGAIPHATTGVAVGWTVIGWDGDWATASGSATADLPHTGSYSEQPSFSADDLGLSLSGGSPGFPVLTAFDLGVEVTGADHQGEYLRSYGVELSGSDPVAVTAEVTNSSLLETAPITVTPTVTAGWVSLADGGAEVAPISYEGEHEIGTVTITE